MNYNIIKILAFTDLHYTTKNPLKRTDNYSESLLLKLNEIGELIIKYDVDIVLFSGDMFHQKGGDVSHAEVNDIIKVISKWKAKLYFIAGNHDLTGYNLNTINNNGIGTLIIGKFAILLNKENPIQFEFSNGKKLNLFGASYSKNYDKNKENYYIDEKYKNDFNINLVHGVLLPKGSFFGDFTLIEEIENKAANITICGHYHPGFEKTIVNNKYFLNPGSLSRGSLNDDSLKRIPKILLIGVDKSYNIKIKEVELKTAKKINEIFDVDLANKQNDYDTEIKNFMEYVKSETQFMGSEDDIQQSLTAMVENGVIGNDVFDKSIEILEKVGVIK